MSQFTNWKRWDNSQNVAVPNPALWNLSTLHFGQFAVDKLQLIYVDVFSHMRLCFKTGLPSACKLDFDPSLFFTTIVKASPPLPHFFCFNLWSSWAALPMGCRQACRRKVKISKFVCDHHQVRSGQACTPNCRAISGRKRNMHPFYMVSCRNLNPLVLCTAKIENKIA